MTDDPEMDTSTGRSPDRLAAVPAVPLRPSSGSVERSTARDVAHGAVLALAWTSILVLWVRVLRGTSPEVLVLAGSSVLVCAIVSVTVTRLWIAHNVGIHRRKGPRAAVPEVPLEYARDWVGRGVVAAWPDVRAAGIVVVCASPARKVFLPDPSIDAIDDHVERTRAELPTEVSR